MSDNDEKDSTYFIVVYCLLLIVFWLLCLTPRILYVPVTIPWIPYKEYLYYIYWIGKEGYWFKPEDLSVHSFLNWIRHQASQSRCQFCYVYCLAE